MNIKIEKAKLIDILKCFGLGILVVVGTFPENDWTYSVGIDSPLSWVFNYIFENGLNIGKHIVFPHGPLAFFMYPLQENIIIATLITSLLKILLVFNIYWLLELQKEFKWFFAITIALIVSIIAGFNHLLLANIILLYCNFFNNEKYIFKLLAFILTAFSFYVKSYVGIISSVLCLSFLVYYFFKNKDYKKTGSDTLTVIGLLLLLWLVMYGTLNGFLNYLAGLFHLAQDNSSAASYYPYNNWWILSIFLIVTFSLPFVNKTKKSLFFGTLITLSLFAAWKHGMAREDIYHVRGFIIYVSISLLIFVLFHINKTYMNITLSTIAIFLLIINSRNSINYKSSKYELFRINNFVEYVSDFEEIKANTTKKIQNNISSNKLPHSIRMSIKNGTVDVYPWDYSIISANNLNWQPRVVLHSYASYTSWLDKRNADHFNSKKAPEYIIWELDKISTDFNGSNFNSIDNRYLLNDEPLTIIQILNNYKHFYSDNKFLVLKRSTTPIKSNNLLIGEDTVNWGEWINVPKDSNSLLRAKLNFKKSILQRIKSFFYKDEQFCIYLKLQNGIIHKYRIVPKNAKDGIWINPYIYDLTMTFDVQQIMFKCSNQIIISKSLNIEWEKIEFEDEPNCIFDFFNIYESNKDSVVFGSVNEFEEIQYPYWNTVSESQISEDKYSGSKAHIVNSNSFSSTFSYSLDSLPFGDYKLVTDCWAKSPKYKYSNNILLVLSIEDKSGSVIWKGLPIDSQLIDKNQWNNIYNFIEYKHYKPNCILKGYFWNTSDKEIIIDNFRVAFLNSN